MGDKFFAAVAHERKLFPSRQEALKDAVLKSMHYDLVIVSDGAEELWRSLKA